MNKITSGNYIQQKRKEKSMTQEQLAEKLEVSNKTISKWECGNSFPDYSFIEKLCYTLDISVSELLNGKDNHSYNEKQMIQMLERIQKLENQKNFIIGILLVILGFACFLMSQLFSGSNFQDFISGVLIGISIGEILVGIFISTRFYFKK